MVPAHTVVPGLVVMLTEGSMEGVTVKVMAGEVAVAGLAQAAPDVITTLTWSPFASVDEEKVAAFAPEMFVPFNCH